MGDFLFPHIFITMNLQEHIRIVLKEETDYMRVLLRRMPQENIDKMDKEFDSSLNYIGSLFIKSYNSDPKKLSLYQFTRMVIQDLIGLLDIRHTLRHYLPEDWFEDVMVGLSKHYKKRITSMYNVLKR